MLPLPSTVLATKPSVAVPLTRGPRPAPPKEALARRSLYVGPAGAPASHRRSGRPHAKLLGVDTQGSDGWSLAWRYPNEATHGHLLIQVNGQGGTVEHDGIAVLHT